PALFLDPGESRNLPEVEQVLRLRQAELHRREQAVSARQELRIVLVTAEQLQHLSDGAGSVVLELGWVHSSLSLSFWIWRPGRSSRLVPVSTASTRCGPRPVPTTRRPRH